MRPWRVAKLSGVALIIAGIGVALWHVRDLNEPALEQVGAVAKGDLAVRVTVAGAIVPRRKVLITPPYNGYIRHLFVKVGDHVKLNEPVVSIAESAGVPNSDIFPIRSSITGEVVQVWREEGEYVSTTPLGTDKDTTIVRIDDLSKLYVQAYAPEIEISKLKLGQAALIHTLAVPGKIYHGKISDISQAARAGDTWDRARVEFPMLVQISDQDGELKPGMSAVFDVIVAEAKDVMTLRQEFVHKDAKGYYVTRADGTLAPVTVGLMNEEAFEIKDGLAVGDQIRQVDFLAPPPQR